MQLPQTIHSKIFTDKDATRPTIAQWAEKGQRVVFTNGCFDIVHKGHIDYLYEASKLADKMVIGLNTDASVQQLKGEGRPVNNNQARALIIAALGFVDMVVFFGEETPKELINVIQPDVLTKGSDYIAENIVGYDTVMAKGGKVTTIDLTDGFSTTDLIERIKKAY
jgi:rfaE bifunctional protein nucleotidyltransferase chain/domain